MVEHKDPPGGSQSSGKTGVSGKVDPKPSGGSSGKTDGKSGMGRKEEPPSSGKTGVSGKVDPKPSSGSQSGSQSSDGKSHMERKEEPPSSGSGSQSSSGGKTEVSGKIDPKPPTSSGSPNQYKVPPPGSNIPMAAWRAMDEDERAAEWKAYQQRANPPKPDGTPRPNINVPPPGSDIPMAAWRAMDEDERAAAWGAPPPGVAIAIDKWRQMPPNERAAIWSSYNKSQQDAPPKHTPTPKPNYEVPPPGSGIRMGEWRAMDEDERAAAWEAYRQQPKPPKPGGGNDLDVPPPGSDIPMAAWRAMDVDERAAEWKAYRERSGGGAPPPRSEGNQVNLAVPPPGSGISLADWKKKDLEQRADIWALYYKYLSQGALTGEKVLNTKLLEFLSENRKENGEPEFVTVQDLIRHFGSGNEFNRQVAALGLDPTVLIQQKYRSFPLRSLALGPPPRRDGVPSTTSEAEKYFITQYKNDEYNPYSTNSGSNNCGPASLAMVLNVLGKMPSYLLDYPEDQIDYVRGLMYPNDPRRKERTLPNGKTIWVVDDDKALSGFGTDDENSSGAIRAARDLGFSTANTQTDWANFDKALAKPVVLSGLITDDWSAIFGKGYANTVQDVTPHFIAVLGKTSSGGYIVADPMYAGGPVVLTFEQLGVFVGKDEDPEFLNMNAP